MLSPEGNLQKYLRLVIGLCLVCAMVQPLLGTLSEGGTLLWKEWLSEEEGETRDYNEIYNQALQSGTKAQATEVIAGRICQAFSLSEETASVEVVFVSENEILSVSEVRVTLRGEGVLTDPREIVSLVNSEWGCSCEVIYE